MGLLAMMAVSLSNTFVCLILLARPSSLFLVKWCTYSVAAKIVLSFLEIVGILQLDG